MNIAYMIAPGRGDTDLLLYQLAQKMTGKGVSTCGTVQVNTAVEGGGPCDMDVQVLPKGPTICISQNLGTQSNGCRLDPEALEGAVVRVQETLEAGADIMIVNKFGKHEADGRGFRSVIGEALMRDVPVLVGTNETNLPAFEEFCGGEAVRVEPTLEKLEAWVEMAMSDKPLASVA